MSYDRSQLDRSPSMNAGDSLEEPYSLDVLPPELLAYIFTFAWPKRRFAHQVPFEVQLSHVCRKWRGIALTTPILWTKISIYSPNSMKWVPTYLQRSGSRLPLSLLIDVYRWDMYCPSHDIAARGDFAASVVSQLAPVFDRVRHLYIMCYHEYTAIAFQSSLALASNLESLSIQFDVALITPPFQISKTLTRGTPKPTFIETPFVSYLSKPTFQHVTTLFLNFNESASLFYPELVEVLNTPTSLRHLSVAGSNNSLLNSWPFHRVGPDPDLQLGNLKSLRIIEGSVLAVKLLLSISAPQLESLWIHCSVDSFHNLFDSQQIVNPIGQSKFRSVKYLTLPEYNLNWILQFAKVFPNITHLHLPHVNFFHIDLLAAALSNWNELQSLVFTQARTARWEKFAIALANMLEERGLTSHPIKSLIMDRDFSKLVQEQIPHISDLVDVLDISQETYKEPWWSKQIGNPFEDEL